MKNHPIASTILALLLIAPAFQIAYHYQRQPDPMASHFNVQGKVDGWMSKQSFVLSQIGMEAGLAAVWLGLIWGIGRLPTRWISMPSRDYWLAPSRRDETLRAVAGQMLWMVDATLLLSTVIFESAYRANYENPPAIGNWGIYSLAAFMGFTVFWVILFRHRFPHVPLSQQTECNDDGT
jgi:uncharacterized membrane protein